MVWQAARPCHGQVRQSGPPTRDVRTRVAALGRLRGRVLDWNGAFGWIAPDEKIAHKDAWKHWGDVYVSREDVDCELSGGSRVTFFAYVDYDGLGAEEVRLEADDGGTSPSPVATRPGGPGAKASKAGHDRAAASGPKAAGRGGPGLKASPPGGAKGPAAFPKKSFAGKGFLRPPGATANGVPGVQRAIEKPAANDGAKCKGKKSLKGAAKAAGKGKALPPMLLAALGLGPNREKSTLDGEDVVVKWASSEMQGWRPAMEDATCVRFDLPAPLDTVAMFAVFDGHGGGEVSRRAAADLPETLVTCARELVDAGEAAPGDSALLEQTLMLALPRFDEWLREEGAAIGGDGGAFGPAGMVCAVDNAFALMGSTAVVALVELDENRRPYRVVVANCGDSRAALCRDGQALQLTEDQKPEADAERERIEAAGGHVAKVGPCFRVDGWGLNLSRALGDFHYKARDDLPPEAQKVSCVPEVCVADVTDEDEFLLLGCDGVFELHGWQDAVDVARNELVSGRSLTEAAEGLVDASCSQNLMETQGQGGDNVSAMLVLLR